MVSAARRDHITPIGRHPSVELRIVLHLRKQLQLLAAMASIPPSTAVTTSHSTTGSTTPPTSTSTFQFPPTYSFPPFFTLQPNSTTRLAQLHKWSSLIQSWCRHHRIWKLSVIDAVETPLFHNTTLRKRISLGDARIILDWMSKSEEEGGGGRRAEWVDGTGTSSGGLGSNGFGGTHQYSSKSDKTMAWIWWRTPEEWAGVVADWVRITANPGYVWGCCGLLMIAVMAKCRSNLQGRRIWY